MKGNRRILAVAMAALVMGALAGPAAAKDGEVIRTGDCSGRADWKLKGAPDDGRLEIEFEVDSNRIGQTYSIAFNPAHRWFWFPRQRREEAIVFKVYDSEKDGRARFTAHTAFEDPTSPPGARPRESIETRMFAFF